MNQKMTTTNFKLHSIITATLLVSTTDDKCKTKQTNVRLVSYTQNLFVYVSGDWSTEIKHIEYLNDYNYTFKNAGTLSCLQQTRSQPRKKAGVWICFQIDQDSISSLGLYKLARMIS